MLTIGTRATLDWRDEELVEAQILPSFRAKYEMWNGTFSMPYAAFRQRLKEIAAQNLARVADARVAPLDDVPEGAWVVPIDDDDWLAPDLVAHVRDVLRPGVLGCSWVHSILETPRHRPGASPWRRLRRRLRARRPRIVGGEGAKGPFICSTNNYILANTPERRPLLETHTLASRFAEAHAATMPRLPNMLSLQNRTLASQTSLAFHEARISRKALLATWRLHVRLYPRVRLSPELTWAAPYVAQVAELTNELQVRA